MVTKIIFGIFSVLATLAFTGEGRRHHHDSREIDYRYGQYRPNNYYGYGYGNGQYRPNNYGYGYGNGQYRPNNYGYGYGNGQNWRNQVPYGPTIGIGGYINFPLQFRGGLLGFLFKKDQINDLPKNINKGSDDSAPDSLGLQDEDGYHVDEVAAQQY